MVSGVYLRAHNLDFKSLRILKEQGGVLGPAGVRVAVAKELSPAMLESLIAQCVEQGL